LNNSTTYRKIVTAIGFVNIGHLDEVTGWIWQLSDHVWFRIGDRWQIYAIDTL